MKILYKLSSFFVVVFVMVFVLTPNVDARRKTVENTGNGTGSLNSAVATSLENIVLEQNNSNRAQNTAASNADSGDNKVEANVGDGSITTGNTEAGNDIANTTNKNELTASCDCNNDEDTAKNIGNGAESVNIATTDTVTLKSSLQKNRNKAENLSTSSARSGGNLVNKNVGSGSVTTGKSRSFNNLLNKNNFNSVMLLP